MKLSELSEEEILTAIVGVILVVGVIWAHAGATGLMVGGLLTLEVQRLKRIRSEASAKQRE